MLKREDYSKTHARCHVREVERTKERACIFAFAAQTKITAGELPNTEHTAPTGAAQQTATRGRAGPRGRPSH